MPLMQLYSFLAKQFLNENNLMVNKLTNQNNINHSSGKPQISKNRNGTSWHEDRNKKVAGLNWLVQYQTSPLDIQVYINLFLLETTQCLQREGGFTNNYYFSVKYI
jgi:hypothetical protein